MWSEERDSLPLWNCMLMIRNDEHVHSMVWCRYVRRSTCQRVALSLATCVVVGNMCCRWQHVLLATRVIIENAQSWHHALSLATRIFIGYTCRRSEHASLLATCVGIGNMVQMPAFLDRLVTIYRQGIIFVKRHVFDYEACFGLFESFWNYSVSGLLRQFVTIRDVRNLNTPPCHYLLARY